MDKHEQRVREIIPDYRANAEQRRAEIVQALREAEAEALERAAKVAGDHACHGV